MRFNRQLTTPRTTEHVYDYLADPRQFAHLFPDCEWVDVHDGSRFTVSIAVGNGQLQGSLEFNMERSEASRPSRLRYTGSGQAAGNLITMDIAFDIAPNSGGTHIFCDCFAEVNGMIMLLAPEMADSMGGKKLDELVASLQTRLASPE